MNFAPEAIHAASTYNWAGTTNLDWNVSTNWTSPDGGLTFPSAQGDRANFNLAAYQELNGRVISLNGNRTLGFISVNGTDALGSMVSFTIGSSSSSVKVLLNAGVNPAVIELTAKAMLTFQANVESSSTSDVIVRNHSQLGGEIRFYKSLIASARNITLDSQFNSIIQVGDVSSASVTKTGSGTLRFSTGAQNYSSFIFNGGVVDVTSAGGSNFFGKEGGTLTIQYNDLSGNTILYQNSSKSAVVGEVIFEPDATLNLARGGNYNDRSNPGFIFNANHFALDTNGNTIGTEIHAEMVVTGQVSGGTLTKTGMGTLTLQNTGNVLNTFGGLKVLSGRVNAQGLSGTDFDIGIGNDSALGRGAIVIDGPYTHLEITSESAGANLNVVNFTNSADITINNGGTLGISNAGRVNFGGGVIEFGGYSNVLLVDAPAFLDGTIFQHAGNATLELRRDVVITGANQVPGSGISWKFSPAAGTIQEISATSPRSLNISGKVEIAGAGTTRLAQSIEHLNVSGEIRFSGGELQLTAPNQLFGMDILFESPLAAMAGIRLGGVEQTFGNVRIAPGCAAYFDFGGDASTRTTLQMGSFTGEMLRIKGWEGDVANLASTSNWDRVSLGADFPAEKVWFYGYEPGAKWVDSSGNPVPPGIGHFLVSAGQRLVSRFDNTVDGVNIASDWRWHNYFNWEGDDPFRIPNAPGVTASIKYGVGALGDGIFSKTISLENVETTVGALDVELTPSSVVAGILTIGGGENAKLVFDSGTAGVPAKLDNLYISVIPSSRLILGVPVVLNGDLAINTTQTNSNARYQFSKKITGSGGIIKEGKGIVILTSPENDFSGGVHLNSGGLILEDGRALGSGRIYLGSASASPVSSIFLAIDADATQKRVTNEVVFQQDAGIAGIEFEGPAITLDKIYNIRVGRFDSDVGSYPDSTPENPNVSIKNVIKDADGESGSFYVSGMVDQSYPNRRLFLRLDNPSNSFSGILTSSGSVAAIVGLNQTSNLGLVIGSVAGGKNYFGTGGIMASAGTFVIKTNEGGKDVFVRGTDPDRPAIQVRWNGLVSIEGDGAAFVDGANSLIQVGSGSLNFATKKNHISSGIFKLTDSGRVAFTRGGSDNEISDGVFKLDSNTQLFVGHDVSAATTDSAPVLLKFTGGSIGALSSTASGGTIVLGDGGHFYFGGTGTLDPKINLLFSNATVDSRILSFGGATATLTFNSFRKEKNGTAFIDDSVRYISSPEYTVAGGTLRIAHSGQLLNESKEERARLVIEGGALALDDPHSFKTLVVKADRGSFNLEDKGGLTFESLESWEGASPGSVPFFLIQGISGSWDGTVGNNYVRFEVEPAPLGVNELNNIAFTGFEAGAAIRQNENAADPYYLVPSGLPTAEWIGSAFPNFSGTNWGDSGNWLNGNIPGTPGGLSSASFRDIDQRLGEDVSLGTANTDGKKIAVDDTYTIARLNVETSALRFELVGAGKLVFEDTPDLSARIKHIGVSTLTISSGIHLQSETHLILDAPRTDGFLHLSGKITGGALVKRQNTDGFAGHGDLRISNPSNEFNGFVWDDDVGHLQIRTREPNATPLGIGLITFGSSPSSVTNMETMESPSYQYGVLCAPGGILLHGDIALKYPTEYASAPSRYTYTGLTIDASGSPDGIRLSPGEHNISSYSVSYDGHAYSVRLKLLGDIHDAEPGQPASLVFREWGSTDIWLNGNSTFSGGTSFLSNHYNPTLVYVGNDNAFGTGVLTLSSGFHLVATDANGVELNTFTQGSRTLVNPLVILDGREKGFYGNWVLDDSSLDMGGHDICIGFGNTLAPANPQMGGSLLPSKNGLVLGENFVITGSNRLLYTGGASDYSVLRFNGSGSTYSGGTEFSVYTSDNKLGRVLLAADAVLDVDGNLLSGPFGTGTITFSSSNPVRLQRIVFSPWSTDSYRTARVIYNPVEFNGLREFEVSRPPEAENVADTIVFASPVPLVLNGANLGFVMWTGSLQIDSPIRDNNNGFTKTGLKSLVLTHPNNAITGQLRVDLGALVARSGSHAEGVQAGSIHLAPVGVAGRSEYFGTSQLVATGTGDFYVNRDDYAGSIAAIATETHGVTTVSTDSSNNQPFHLLKQAMFVAGGSATGMGMGFQGAGILRMAGPEGAMLHGQPLYTPDNPDAGWLVADTVRMDMPGLLRLGMNIRANHLQIGNGGTLWMADSNRLSGVVRLEFDNLSGGFGDSGTLDLNGKSQALRADVTDAPSGRRVSAIHVAQGVTGYIKLTDDTALSPAMPLRFTFGRIAEGSTGELHFINWQGDPDTGLGATRIIVTDYRRGEVVPNLYLEVPGGGLPSGMAIVKSNPDGERVLVPVQEELTWSGYAAEIASDAMTPANTYWEHRITPAGEQYAGGTFSNWEDRSIQGGPTDRWPGQSSMRQDAGRIVSFDTRKMPGNDAWNWGNLVIPITTDGFEKLGQGISNYDTGQAAIAGTIRLYGSNSNAQVTFASPDDVSGGITGPYSPASNPKLTLDGGASGDVANILVEVRGRLRFNLPIFLLDDNSADPAKSTTLVINTVRADSFVELNDTVMGSGDFAFIEKRGQGHLFIRGTNDGSNGMHGLAGGILLEGGHLYLGSPASVGAVSQGARLNLLGGTLHTVEDWFNPGGVGVPSQEIYKPGLGAPGSGDPNGELRPADLTIPNDYRLMGGVTLAGNKTLTLRNPLGDGVLGDVTVPSVVTIADPSGRLVLDGHSLTSTVYPIPTLTFDGPGGVFLRKSSRIAGVDIIANASAADAGTALVEISAKAVGVAAPPLRASSVINRGHGELRLSSYDGTGGSYGLVANEGPGVLAIRTENYAFTRTLANTGTPDSPSGLTGGPTRTALVRISGAGNTFSSGITVSNGGTIDIDAPTTVIGNVNVSNGSLLRIAAPVTAGPSDASMVSLTSMGRLMLDVDTATGSIGTLDTGSGGFVTIDNGILDFVVSAGGSHGLLSTSRIDTANNAFLQLRYDNGFDPSQFAIGYEINLFDASNGAPSTAPATFTNGAGWFFGANVSITHGGAPVVPPSGTSWKFDRLATEGVLYIGTQVSAGLYWDGTTSANVWNTTATNMNWRKDEAYALTRAQASAAGGNVPFSDRSRVIFDVGVGNDAAAGEEDQVLGVNVGTAIYVHSLLVTGPGSNFVFSGSSIRVSGPYVDPATNPNDPYAGILPALDVTDRATARFETPAAAPFLRINGGSTVTLVWSGSDPVGKFRFLSLLPNSAVQIITAYDTLVLEYGTTRYGAFSQDNQTLISGRGNLVKTGTGRLRMGGENTYNGVRVVGSEWKTFGGSTTVDGGELEISRGLGNGSPDFSYETHYLSASDILSFPTISRTSTRDYLGQITIGPSGTLAFRQQGNPAGQRLSGHIGHLDTPIGPNGVTHEASVDGQLLLSGDYYEIASRYNSFQGTLTIGPIAAHVRLLGGLGTLTDTYNSGTPAAVDYYRNDYSGSISISSSSIFEHANSRDPQIFRGVLTGPEDSIFRKTGSAAFHFQGDARGFSGHTRIENGLFSISNSAGNNYGSSNTKGSFHVGNSVGGVATLQTSSGTKIQTGEFILHTGSTLISGPSYFSAPSVGEVGLSILSQNVSIRGGSRIVVQTSSAMLVGLDPVSGKPSGITGSGTAAAISMAQGGAGGGYGRLDATTGGPITLSITPAYIPIDTDEAFLLMQNVSIVGADPTLLELDWDNPALLNLFSQDSFNFLSGDWHLYWKNTNLYLYRYAWRGMPSVPEPSTYALCGSLATLALTLFRRRKNRKK
ncbi:MAG: hypothetical protein LBG65_00525 [Puniceicoccales bacterium]|nr:hypothetical protein [Puniceicoccales bacterium]